MVKTYIVRLKEQPSIYYFVDAPNKRIAKWGGAACYNHEYAEFTTAKDFTVKRFRYEEVKND